MDLVHYMPGWLLTACGLDGADRNTRITKAAFTRRVPKASRCTECATALPQYRIRPRRR